MNYLDIVLLIFFLWAAYRGFSKGFIIAASTLAALVLGIYGGIHFSGYMASLLESRFESDIRHIEIIAFAITFIVIVILVHIIAWLTDKLVRAVALGFVNRILGVIFNSVKVGFILSVLLGIINYFDVQEKLISREVKDNSILYHPVAAIAPAVFPYLSFERLWEPPDKIKPSPSKNELFTGVWFYETIPAGHTGNIIDKAEYVEAELVTMYK